MLGGSELRGSKSRGVAVRFVMEIPVSQVIFDKRRNHDGPSK
jgi:hypothetical protein